MFGTVMTMVGTFFYCKKELKGRQILMFSLSIRLFRLYHVKTQPSTTSS